MCSVPKFAFIPKKKMLKLFMFHTHKNSILFQFILNVLPHTSFQSTSSCKILFYIYIKHTYDHFILDRYVYFWYEAPHTHTHKHTGSTKTKMHFSLLQQQQQNYNRCAAQPPTVFVPVLGYFVRFIKCVWWCGAMARVRNIFEYFLLCVVLNGIFVL